MENKIALHFQSFYSKSLGIEILNNCTVTDTIDTLIFEKKTPSKIQLLSLLHIGLSENKVNNIDKF